MVNYNVRKYSYTKTCRCAYIPLQEPEGSQRQLLISVLCGNGRESFIEKFSFKKKASIIEQKNMLSCFYMGCIKKDFQKPMTCSGPFCIVSIVPIRFDFKIINHRVRMLLKIILLCAPLEFLLSITKYASSPFSDLSKYQVDLKG